MAPSHFLSFKSLKDVVTSLVSSPFIAECFTRHKLDCKWSREVLCKGGSILRWHNDCVWLISSGERFEKKACCGKEAHNTRSRRRHPRLKVEISSNGWMKPVLFTVHQADLWNELLVAMLSVKRCPPHTHTPPHKNDIVLVYMYKDPVGLLHMSYWCHRGDSQTASQWHTEKWEGKLRLWGVRREVFFNLFFEHGYIFNIEKKSHGTPTNQNHFNVTLLNIIVTI